MCNNSIHDTVVGAQVGAGSNPDPPNDFVKEKGLAVAVSL